MGGGGGNLGEMGREVGNGYHPVHPLCHGSNFVFCCAECEGLFFAVDRLFTVASHGFVRVFVGGCMFVLAL